MQLVLSRIGFEFVRKSHPKLFAVLQEACTSRSLSITNLVAQQDEVPSPMEAKANDHTLETSGVPAAPVAGS